MPRRERGSILADILASLEAEAATPEPRITNVAMRANVPYDRLQAYLATLQERGLVALGENGRMPRVTPAGQEFLRAYRQWGEALDRFGIG